MAVQDVLTVVFAAFRQSSEGCLPFYTRSHTTGKGVCKETTLEQGRLYSKYDDQAMLWKRSIHALASDKKRERGRINE